MTMTRNATTGTARRAAAPGAFAGAFAGTGALVRLVLRRDRIRLPAWFGAVVLLAVAVAASLPATLPTEAARAAFAATNNTDPTQLLLIGPVFDHSEGALAAWRVRGQAALLIALASMLAVLRHTRGDEESGRRELLGSTVVGRHSPMAAALLVVAAANLLAAVAIAAGFTALGSPAAGALAFGLSVAAAGWFFAAVAAVTAQLVESARSALGLAAATMGVFYAMRGAADIGAGAWLSALTPFGWTQRVRPFAGDHWWPIPFTLLMAALVAAVAFLLSARRDLGAGVLPPRLGPAAAAPGLRSPLALAVRLQRGSLIGWVVSFTGLGVGIGFTAQSAADLVADSSAMAALVGTGGRPVDGFFALVVHLMSQVVSVYAIQAVLRMRAEEAESRAQTLLAGPVARVRWAGGHLLVAAVGSAAILVGTGAGIGLSYGLAVGDLGGEMPSLLLAAVVRVPSVWIMAAIAAALYGWKARTAAVLAYGALVVFLILELAVSMMGAPHVVLAVSPFAWTPGLPVAAFAALPLLALTAVAATLTALGLGALRARDLD